MSTRGRRVAEELYGLMTVVLHGVPRDLGLTALSTLGRVERTGPRRITDLAVAEGITQPSMTTLVTNLERGGYLERRRQEDDGRVTLVAITPQGSSLLKERRRIGAAAMDHLINELTPDEVAVLEAAAPVIARLRALDGVRADGVVESA